MLDQRNPLNGDGHGFDFIKRNSVMFFDLESLTLEWGSQVSLSQEGESYGQNLDSNSAGHLMGSLCCECGNSESPVLTASRQGHPSCLKAAIDAGADVEVRDKDHYSPIFHVVRCGSRTLPVEVGPIWDNDHAQQKGREYEDAHPDHRWTKRWWTTIEGQMSVLEVVMPRHARNRRGVEYEDCLKELIDSKVNLNATDEENCSAVMLASYLGDSSHVKLIADAKADLSITTTLDRNKADKVANQRHWHGASALMLVIVVKLCSYC